jgi:predicted nucleotidyltransferase component of viral defense system
LRLYDCPRSTTDIDYCFAPVKSKRDLVDEVRRVLEELEGVVIDIQVHSKVLRATVELDGTRIQVEANVAAECRSEPMATAGFARSLGQPSQVVRVMSPDLALSHKLAAWNERRLHRDLYDIYFLYSRTGASPDVGTLTSRLAEIDSRLPDLRTVRSMTIGEFAAELRRSAAALDEAGLQSELGALLPENERAGLLPRIRSAMVGVAERFDMPA